MQERESEREGERERKEREEYRAYLEPRKSYFTFGRYGVRYLPACLPIEKIAPAIFNYYFHTPGPGLPFYAPSLLSFPSPQPIPFPILEKGSCPFRFCSSKHIIAPFVLCLVSILAFPLDVLPLRSTRKHYTFVAGSNLYGRNHPQLSTYIFKYRATR